MFSFEYCEIFKYSFFHRTPPVAASVSALYPHRSLSIYDLFQVENSNLRALTTCFLANAGFLRYIEVSVIKRDDTNIENTHTYMGCII